VDTTDGGGSTHSMDATTGGTRGTGGAGDTIGTTDYETAGGIRVTRTATPVPPASLDALVAAVGERRGGVLSSGMEYPGRYDRWAYGYVDPCVELIARGRRIAVHALNRRGRVLLPVIAAAMEPAGRAGARTAELFEMEVPPGEEAFAEEDRSRRPTVFTAVRALVALFRADADPHLGLYGAFGYDLAFQFEPVPLARPRPSGQRDLILHLPDEILVIDRKRETSIRYSYDFSYDSHDFSPDLAIGTGHTAGLERTSEPTPRPRTRRLPDQPTPGVYADVVREAKERFLRGDLFEVVPSHVVYGPCDSPPVFFERLRATNPAPYEFFLNLGEGEYLVGASPEMFVRVTGGSGASGGSGGNGGGEGVTARVETCPIAGTIRRGRDPLEDAENIRELLNSAKDESELTMCTDVDRNDKSRVCLPGTIKVIGRRQIEMYSRLIHTVDHVEGRLRPGYDALDAFLTHMWAVTVTGAPKTWAMRFIEEHEDAPRRWYGGAVGFVGFDGSMNTGLTLRTAHIENGVAAVRVGATLLHDSDPEAEERETHLKARALLDALSAPEPPAAGAYGPRSGTAAGSASTASGSAAAAGSGPAPAGGAPRVLVVDHEDSFVNTLADYFRQHGAEVTTLRYGFPARRLDELAPDLVVLSPGPGRPADFDCAALLEAVYARGLPSFGVCLGLQAMVEHAGGELALLGEPAHGKPGRVKVLGGEIFAGLPDEFTAARYHSLHTTPERVRGFAATAMLDGVVMAIEHPDAPRWAVQFHPESILTAAGGAGHRIIGNVLRMCREAGRQRGQ
jgi:anthranilate synthase